MSLTCATYSILRLVVNFFLLRLGGAVKARQEEEKLITLCPILTKTMGFVMQALAVPGFAQYINLEW